ncbi:hypothetical protein LEP1GSC197_1715 [Leptospira interrogans serovar Pomona str. CSL4002]|nr:hypothetical protein LEP1GSC197_1715 [Leptospira interrogans serovar Pomona str. CSL4002]
MTIQNKSGYKSCNDFTINSNSFIEADLARICIKGIRSGYSIQNFGRLK